MKIIRQRQVFIAAEKSAKFFDNCPRCDGSMYAVAAVGKMFSISERSIYRLIEAERIHFTEFNTAAYVCIRSLLAEVEREA